MTDEAAFLSAIAATPEDTALRLVFADWLDEHDDFRGEFVRAAVAFDCTPPYDIRRFRLGARLQDLLESPALKTWLPTKPAFKWGWRRGLLTLLADTTLLQAEHPATTARWLASNWIERVEFDGNTFGLGLEATRAEFGCDTYNSRPEWWDTFDLARNTRELHFGRTNYGPDVLTHLREWPHLRALGIPYLGGPWTDLAALPHLRALTLDEPTWTIMPELPHARLPDLAVLSINKEWYGDLPHWGACFPKLRSLALTHYSNYPDEQCERFAECPQLRHLALHLQYQRLTRVALKALTKAKELRSLSLAHPTGGTVEGLGGLPKLEYLHVNGEAKPIRGLASLAGLRWLSLGLSTLTKPITAQTLRLPHLARLDLCCHAFEVGAVASLAKAPALRVVTVDLRGGTPAPSELVRLEGLQYLRFSPPGLAPADLRSLQTALPACRIVNGSWGTGDDEYDWS